MKPRTIPKEAVTIGRPVRVSHMAYDRQELASWRQWLESWVSDERSNPTVLGRYQRLAREGRIICFKGAPRAHGFAEARVALELEAQGYTCWTGAQLFPWNGRNVRAPDRKKNTLEVADAFARQGLAFPRELQPRLRAWEQARRTRVRNPDLVCLHGTTDKWLFVEVKRDREEVEAGQWASLAVLRWLAEELRQ